MDKKIEVQINEQSKQYQEILEKEIGKDTLEFYTAIMNGTPIDETKYEIEYTELGKLYKKREPIDPSVERVKNKIKKMLND